MKVFKLFYVLYKINLLSPIALYRLTVAILKNGTNLMALLHFAKMKYVDVIALVDDHKTISYGELFMQSNRLAFSLKENINLSNGQKVGLLCKNHASLVKSIFAVSRLGADVYLLNTEASQKQFNETIERHQFDLLIYDLNLSPMIEQSHYKKEKILSYHDSLPAISNFLLTDNSILKSLPRNSTGRIVLQTSGTTGASKDVPHQPSLFNYLNPFAAFIKRLKILDYQTAYIATPIYHGYGFAVLLLFIPLGKKIIISRGFNAEKACLLISKHHVEVATVVPLMLDKMLATNVDDMKSLRCIASGSGVLSPKLVSETFSKLGDVLYNLYGTSEAGLNFIATPEDLRYSASTIGKKINGVKIYLLDKDMNRVEEGKIGQFFIKNEWSMSQKNRSWISTGDLGLRDENGYYYLHGRTDDMVVSGGVNVYPIEVEQILIKHPLIKEVAVIGVPDSKFGQRLKAFVLLNKSNLLTEDDLFNWLHSKVARFQMPREIIIVDAMPYTPLGKLDKSSLIKLNRYKVNE